MTSKVKTDLLSPEMEAEDARIREEIEAELPEIRARAYELHDIEMQKGMVGRRTIAILRHERERLGLSDEEMITRSGLDAKTLATMIEPGANPTLSTVEAYAAAVGKTVRILLDPQAEETG